MPELPEVEYLARQLRETLPGHRFVGVETRWERTIAGMTPAGVGGGAQRASGDDCGAPR